MKTKVAINGFGRIGRAFFKLAFDRDEIEVVAINDLGNVENLAYLLTYDTAYGKSDLDIKFDEKKNILSVNGKKITVLQEPDPSKLPWKKLGIDIALESTGFFVKHEQAKMHLDAGAKKVVISAPAKGEPVTGIASATVLMGVNEDQLKTCQISSNGSCTTNAGSPVISIIQETLGIKKAILNTVHGYTATQNIVDGPTRNKDFRRGRAGAQNIVPTSTGAAIAITQAIPELENKFDGVAMRVPVISGSLADITILTSKKTSVKEVNKILEKAAKEERWKGIFKVNKDLLVSSDIVGDTYASIVDLQMTRVVDGDLIKILAWYDNEMGYTYSLVEHVIKTAKSL